MKLVIEDEAGTRTVLPLGAEPLVVGRAAEGVGWRLPDRNVSRRHARFVNQGGVVSVEDLGSLTGTRVNGERIEGRRRLRIGDLVEIGDYDLVVLPEGVEAQGIATPPPLPAITPRAPVPVVTPPAPVATPPEPPPPTAAPGPAAAGPRPPAPGGLGALLERLRARIRR